MADQTYMRISEAAAQLGLSPKILTGMSQRGDLPPYTVINGRKYFRREQLQRALADLEKKQANNRKWA